MLTPKKICEINILDDISSEIISGCPLIKSCLTFEKTYWVKNGYKKVKKSYNKCLIKDNKYIYNGWIDRIKTHCLENKIVCKVNGETDRLTPTNEPFIEGVDFRDYQEIFVKIGIEKQLGIFDVATAAGKSYLSLGIISAFEGSKTLYLVPSVSLMYQAAKDFSALGHDVSMYGDGFKDDSKNIVIAILNSARKFDFNKIKNSYQILIVDEAHLSVDTIEKIVGKLNTKIRIALSATVPEDIERALILEGLFGEIIATMDYQDAREANIVTDAEVKIIDVPSINNYQLDRLISAQKEKDNIHNKEIKLLIKEETNEKAIEKLKGRIIKKTKYQYVRQVALVQNEERNNLILDEGIKIINKGMTTIIFVTMIEHIDILSSMLKERNVYHKCVYGDIGSEEREEIKKELLNKDLKLLISSVVWKTGLDIKTLNSIIVTDGKSKQGLKQGLGRALRVCEGKEKAYIVDFYDHVEYLEKHSEARFEVYKENGWKIS